MAAPRPAHPRPRRSRPGAAAAAAAAAAVAVAAVQRRPEVPGRARAGAAWVPAGAAQRLGRRASPSTLAGRPPAARRGGAGGGLKASEAEEEEEEGEASVKMSTRQMLMLLLSCMLGPALCVGFVRFRSAMNNLVVGYGAMTEMSVYLATSAVLFGVLKSNLIGGSAQSFVFIFVRLVQKLNGDRETWGTETLRKLGKPLSNICQGMLSFLAVNLMVNAIPDSWSWDVPRILGFCDINGDGTLEANEIEEVFYGLTSRVLGCFVMLQVGRLLSSFRKPLNSEISPNTRGVISKYFRGVQRLKNKVRRRAGEDDTNVSVAFWLGDLAFAAAIWVGICFSWVMILGIPPSAVATALAPLGIGGLAFSLASKNIVQNLISGVLMFLNRAFVEGDEIHSLDGKIRGVVAKVGLINTEVLRLEGDPVVLPNTELVNNGIVNLQRRDFWLIDKAVPLYMPSFERLEEVVKAMDEVLKQQVANILPGSSVKSISVYEEPLCYFEGFGHQGATIRARAYIDGALPRHRFYKVRSDILLKLNEVAFQFSGAGIAFEGHMLGSFKLGEGGHDGGHGHDHSHGAAHGDDNHKNGQLQPKQSSVS